MLTFHASALQLKAGPDKAKNLADTAVLVSEAAQQGSRLVVLPEMFPWRGAQADEAAAAEPVPGPTSEWACDQARRHGLYLVAGSLLERDAADGKCFNTSLLVGPDGEILGHYRKLHLFDVDIPGKVSIAESKTRAPGEATVCVKTELGTIGLSICYDLRFPELYRQLAEAGAEIIVLPAAFTAPTGTAHWEPLIRARAIENQCWFVAANQVGPTGQGFSDHGHSMIVDPWGQIVSELDGETVGVADAELSAERLEKVRRELPSLKHRKLP